MAKPARPGLKFSSLDDLLDDARKLLAGPYEKAGQWDLGMIMDHLTKTMNLPFAANPGWNPPWPIAPIMGFFYSRFARREFYPNVKFPMPGFLAPTAGGEIGRQFAEMAQAVEKVKNAPGDSIECPPFGRLSRVDFERMQLLHGAHHLSFLKSQS